MNLPFSRFGCVKAAYLLANDAVALFSGNRKSTSTEVEAARCRLGMVEAGQELPVDPDVMGNGVYSVRLDLASGVASAATDACRTNQVLLAYLPGLRA